jgi:hypothetical protein
MTPIPGFRPKALLLVSGLLLTLLQPTSGVAAGYGKLAGVVSDNQGIPLMGANVMLMGPTAFAASAADPSVKRVVTDARGRFTIAQLIPGWYSLKVSSPTRLPVMRNRLRVLAGETVMASFVLTDTFAPIRLQVPNDSVSSWGDDWKWVLRTSSTTRPILRYHQDVPSDQAASQQDEKPVLPSSERFVGVLPGSAPRDPLAENFGMATMFAYLQSLSPDSDMLAEGTFAPVGENSVTAGTLWQRNELKGEPQQFGLVFHQLSLVPGASDATGMSPSALGQAKAMVATYSQTRLLAPQVTVTAGMDVDFLNALDNVLVAQPHMKLEYQATPQTMVSVQAGSATPDAFGSSMMERLGLLNAFPQITQRDGHLELEQLNHTEVALNHRIGKSARVQAAAYHDSVHNAAIWGVGSPAYAQQFAGNSLPNPVGSGTVINAGDYRSAGFRAVYAQTWDSRVEVMGMYATGDALSAYGYSVNGSQGYSPNMLIPRQSQAVSAKVTAELPGTHTRVSTSYEWVRNDRVTLVDPAGQADLQVQPYLGVHVRQPIPTPSFLPVHIDAVADFQNLLSQGFIPTGQAGPKTVVLTSGYHYVSGGFSVQF